MTLFGEMRAYGSGGGDLNPRRLVFKPHRVRLEVVPENKIEVKRIHGFL
jgi:hypothetical protein